MENPQERGTSSKVWKQQQAGRHRGGCCHGDRWAGEGRKQKPRVPAVAPNAGVVRTCLSAGDQLSGSWFPGNVVVKGLVRTDCPSGPGPGRLRLSPSQWPHSDPRLVSHTRTAAQDSHSRAGATPSVHSEGCPIQEVGFQVAPHDTPGRAGFVLLWAGEETAGLWRPGMDSGRGLPCPGPTTSPAWLQSEHWFSLEP